MLSPRFRIAEEHGLQEPKYRLIDDLTKSLANGAVETTEAYCPHDLDSFVALTRLQKYHGSRHLRAWSLYFSHAYKTIAIHPGSAEASYICIINPANNRPYTARILAQPFGSRRSPANWGRVVTSIQFVARKLLRLAVGAFDGDVYCADDAKIDNSGFCDSEHLRRLHGCITSDKQDQKPAMGLTLLGAEVSLSIDAIRAQACTKRVLKIKGHISQALQLNFLTPAASSKIRGKLGFLRPPLNGETRTGHDGPPDCTTIPFSHYQTHEQTAQVSLLVVQRFRVASPAKNAVCPSPTVWSTL